MKNALLKKSTAFALFLAAIVVLVVWSARQFVEGAIAPAPVAVAHRTVLSLSQASCKTLVQEMVGQAWTLTVNGVVIKAQDRPPAPQEAIATACEQHPMATVAVDRPAP